jgi:Ca-activated chloride channel family protein
MSFEFARPWVLLLLLLPLAYVIWFRRRRGLAYPLPRAEALAQFTRPSWQYLGLAPQLLRAAVLMLLVVALAGPRAGAAAIDVRTEGIPMVLAIDISSSMLAEDFSPRNRLQVARETVARFIAGREADPVGLVAFAGEAITQVPLTLDHPVLFSALNNLQVGLLEDGTAIGMGLATAVNRLRRVPGDSKVVILMSDGENNRGEIEPLEAAAAAAAYGIQVFTIGVGSDERAAIPVQRAAGTEYVELSAGLDEELLRQIADMTGGQYFRATNAAALEEIYARIDQLVKTPVESRRYVRFTERHLAFLFASMLLLLAEWVLRGSRWGRMP